MIFLQVVGVVSSLVYLFMGCMVAWFFCDVSTKPWWLKALFVIPVVVLWPAIMFVTALNVAQGIAQLITAFFNRF